MTRRVHLFRDVEAVPDPRGPTHDATPQRVAACGLHGDGVVMTTDETLVTCPKCRDNPGPQRPRIVRPLAPTLVKDSQDDF